LPNNRVGLPTNKPAYSGAPDPPPLICMCEKCEDIDVKIARYRRLSADVDDDTVITLVNAFIVDLEAEKAALHPVHQEPRK
jgi:hypothetical protein